MGPHPTHPTGPHPPAGRGFESHTHALSRRRPRGVVARRVTSPQAKDSPSATGHCLSPVGGPTTRSQVFRRRTMTAVHRRASRHAAPRLRCMWRSTRRVTARPAQPSPAFVLRHGPSYPNWESQQLGHHEADQAVHVRARSAGSTPRDPRRPPHHTSSPESLAEAEASGGSSISPTPSRVESISPKL